MFLRKLVKNIYDNMLIFMRQNILEMVLLLMGIAIMGFVKTVPYMNLLLIRPEVEFFLIFLLAILLFSSKVKHAVLLFLIIVFFLLVFFSLLQSKFLTEQMGNVLYAFLVIGYIQFLISLKKNK